MVVPYRYCRDRVFLTALTLYLLNRWLFKPLAVGHVTFFAYYGNDLLCIPFCLPPCLFAYRLLGLRDPGAYPTRFELLSHIIVWSFFFEWLAPIVIKGPFAWTVADPWDMVAYTVGGLIAGWYWGTWNCHAKKTPATPTAQPKEAV